MACVCLSLVSRSSGAKPFVPFGKAAKVLRKAGTRDAGPCSPTGPKGQAVRSAPGRDQAESAVYTRISPWRNRKGGPGGRRRTGFERPPVHRPDTSPARPAVDGFGHGNPALLDSPQPGVSYGRRLLGASMSIAFVFPGQGSQVVGMGKALADNFTEARNVFAEVDNALGEKLTTVMWDGPVDRLTLTENAQPALMAVSLAAMRVLEAEAGLDLKRDAAFVAGHSLGEYSALAAAGSLTITDTARLLRIRGRAMQAAVPVGVGAMAALLGLEFDAACAVAAEAAQGEVAQAANDNGAGQVVVSGSASAIARAIEIAKAKGAKRAMLLPVSAPFHCALMQPAADMMAEALSRVTVKPPAVPLVANVLARAVTDPAEIVTSLVAQVTGTVRWRECVVYMATAGVDSFYEVGAGKVLSGLVKRIADGANAIPIGTPDEVAAFKTARGN